MKDWKYDELIGFIREDFIEYKEKGGFTNGQSAERCFYEFYNTINSGYTEKCTVYSTIGQLLVENNDVTQQRYKEIGEVLNSFDKSKVIDKLPIEDVEKLIKQVNSVKKSFEEIINKKKITVFN